MKLGQRKGVSKEYQAKIYQFILNKSIVTMTELQEVLPHLTTKSINFYFRLASSNYRFNYTNAYNSNKVHVHYKITHY